MGVVGAVDRLTRNRSANVPARGVWQHEERAKPKKREASESRTVNVTIMAFSGVQR